MRKVYSLQRVLQKKLFTCYCVLQKISHVPSFVIRVNIVLTPTHCVNESRVIKVRIYYLENARALVSFVLVFNAVVKKQAVVYIN